MTMMIRYLVLYAVVATTLIGDGSCHGESHPTEFGDNNHPHYVPGAIEVYEGSCVGSVITNKLVSTIKNTTGSDEDDEMMAQSRSSRNDGACLHVTREINLGPGITGHDIFLNVSVCQDTSTDYDPQSDKGFCYARKTIVHRINLPNESKNMKSAKFCRDMRETELKDACRRLNTTEVYYQDLLQQVPITVNVGHCGGTCSNDGSRCTPTSFSSVSVQTPNGEETVPVIAECGCVKSCYRNTHYELYRVTTEDGKCIEKYIDVGLCAGNCAPSCRFDTPWAPVPGSFGDHPCMKPKCIAASYSYYRIEEARVDIPVINECHCVVSGYIVD